MRIENTFNKFLEDIEIVYNSEFDTLQSLELKLFSPEELFESGFIAKNIEGFFNGLNPLSNNDINVYFNTHLRNLPPDEIPLFNMNFGGNTVGDFVTNLKLNFIKSYLSKQLFEFIKSLKESVF
jgi:hypothetical protein